MKKLLSYTKYFFTDLKVLKDQKESTTYKNEKKMRKKEKNWIEQRNKEEELAY